MIESFLQIHPGFKLNGKEHSISDLISKKNQFFFSKELTDFFLEWFNKKSVITIATSGSTGKPKKVLLNKKDMIASAKNTGNYFKLKPGNKALLCLPIKFIGGKMMIVRALVLGLDLYLVKPSRSPIKEIFMTFDFVAMTPFQLQGSINFLHNIKCLIVGGGAVNDSLAQKIKNLPTKIFETYGMTETMSHVAVKSLNNGKGVFSALPGIYFSVKNNCLEIMASYVSKDPILTNDRVDLISDTEFRWLGREDFIINSGGIKLNPEKIENNLSAFFKIPFIISSTPDKSLGEQIVIVFEKEVPHNAHLIFNKLGKYERPKKMYTLSKFKKTNGKLDRIFIKNELLKTL